MADLVPDWARHRAKRLVLTNPNADKLLREALAEIDATGGYSRVRSILVTHRDHEEKLILHLVPILRDARDVFSKAAAMILATPVNKRTAPDVETVQGLFDLTPAEAAVVANIVAGLTIRQIAERQGTSLATIRNQLNRALSKSVLHRQVELVSALKDISTFGKKPE